MAAKSTKPKKQYSSQSKLRELTDVEREEDCNTGLSPCFNDLLLARPMPQTRIFQRLDLYFTGYFESVTAAIEFLEYFTYDAKEEDLTFFDLKGLRAFFDCYHKLPDELRNDPRGLSLDILIRQAEQTIGYPKGYLIGEVRRALNWAIDRRGEELAMLNIAINKPLIIEKSVQVALDESHPDSYNERKALMQYFNIAPVPKNAAINVNIDQSSKQVQIKGLPSFSKSIEGGQVSLKELGEGASQQTMGHLGSKKQDYIEVETRTIEEVESSNEGYNIKTELDYISTEEE